MSTRNRWRRVPHSFVRMVHRGIACLLVAAVSGMHAMPAAAATSTHCRIVGYTTGWDANENPQLAQIDTLIFAFAHIRGDEAVLAPEAALRLDQLVALEAVHPALKVVVSIGGWGVDGFSGMASSASGREHFAASIVHMLRAHHADGIDLDWEYPGHHESGIRSSPKDRSDFTLLLATVRAGLDRASRHDGRKPDEHYTLSAAVADGPFVSDIDIGAAAKLVDWFNLMTYDFVNSRTPTTGHHTGLYFSAYAPADARTVDRAVRQFLTAGAPAGKLLIGVAMYGREFADVQSVHDGLYQPYGHYAGGHPWPALKRDFIDRNDYVRHWDEAAQAPWLWNARAHAFISYDDTQSIAAKAAYVKAHHLGGIMYWEQQQDPSGELLDAIHRGLQ